MNSRKVILGILILVAIVYLFKDRTHKGNDNYFKTQFYKSPNQNWLGPDYWTNPLQDWQISNGIVECLVSDKNRNVHLLTRGLSDITGELKMKARIGFYNLKIPKTNDNWAGFSIGSKGKFSDYRDDALNGIGLNLGVTTNGSLFIGNTNPNNANPQIVKELARGIDLIVHLSPVKQKYRLDLTVKHITSGEILASISKENIFPNQVVGDLVLVSNYIDQEDKKSIWIKDWELKGSKLKEYKDRAFGPIMFSQYTLNLGILKLSAQMAPVDLKLNNTVKLNIKLDGEWKEIGLSTIDPESRTALFRIKGWDHKINIPYRLEYNLSQKGIDKTPHYWEGIIRAEPLEQVEVVIAAFTGNNDLGFPNTDIFDQVKQHDPDLLFFSGDQIYESVGGFGFVREPYGISVLDYLRKWYLYGWAYRDLMKDRPTISIPDDHDVYMGNIWGESGKSTIQEGSKTDIQDSGGYRMPPKWVNMVQKTQTSHLPDPYDPMPVLNEIGVYYTHLNYGGLSMAVLEDRKFKSAPKNLIPEAQIVNGWPQNKNFNMADADNPEAKLLGNRQLAFLSEWSKDWSHDAEHKVVLSQTIFANVATLPKEAMTDEIVPTLRILNKGEYPENDSPVTDFDSNAWPQTGRNKAINIMRKGFAFHLAGDQHLGSLIQYGITDYQDSGYAFCVPSISNFWPRRWYPAPSINNDIKIESPKYTGDYLDGFGNKISVSAVSNPYFTNKKPSNLHDRATGYGIVRFNKNTRKIKIECWPRGADLSAGDKEQYLGWPIEIDQLDNYAKQAVIYLPEIQVSGIAKPVIHIYLERDNSHIYSLRTKSNTFLPKVFEKGSYTIIVEDPQQNKKITQKNINSELKGSSNIQFFFNENAD
jgi:hypothetical protein